MPWRYVASLDRQTLLAVTAAIALLTSMLLATFTRVVPAGVRGLGWCVGAFACYGIATALRLPVAGGAAAAVDAFLPSLFDLAANALLFVGVCRFYGVPIARGALSTFVAADFLWLAHAFFIASSQASAVLALTAGQCALPLAVGIVVWRHRGPRRLLNGHVLAAVVAFAQAGIVLANAALILNTWHFHVQIFQAAEMLVVLVGAVAMVQIINERMRSELEFMATHDFLTGALTRRALMAQLDKELARARRSGRYPALCMIDVDHFKALNDRHGHATGDRVLKALVGVANGCLRAADTFARYGGEEFLALLPETTLEEACTIADRLRLAIEGTNFGTLEAPIRTTVSIGIAQCSPADQAERSLDHADRALYTAKGEGRNKTALYGR